MAKPLVKITDKSGVIQEVPANEAASYLQMGYTQATEADVAAATERERYSGLGAGLAAGGLGALRGATVGLSDPLIANIGGESARQYVAGVKNAHPDISTAGELAGIIAPALVGDEAGLLGQGVRAVGAPARLVGSVGGLAERAAVGLVGRDAAGLGARALQAAIRTGAQGAAEGALFGAGAQYADDALHDHATTAQSLLAAGYDGALYGGLAGGALGGGGEVLATGARRIGNLATDLGSSVLGRKTGETLSEYLDREAGAKAFKAAGGTQNSVKLADSYAGGSDAVGRVWLEEAPALAGKQSFSAMTRDDLVIAAKRGLEREGARIDEALSRAQLANDARVAQGLPSVAPKATDVVGEVEHLARDAANKPGARPVYNKLQEFANDIKRITGMTDIDGNLVPHARDIEMSFEQLRNFRIAADEMWTSLSGAPELKGYKKEFRKLRSIMEDQLTNAGESAAGSSFVKTYNEAKKMWQAFKILEKNSAQGVARETANKTFGLSATLSSNAAAGIGATMGGAVLGAPGAFVGSMIGKGVGAVGSKLVQKHGDFVAAEMLSRAAKIQGLNAQTAKIGGTITRAMDQFFDRSTATSAVSAAHEFRERPPSKEHLVGSIKHVQDLASNPTKLSQAVSSAIGPSLPATAPKVASSAAQTLAIGVQFLASKAPKGIGNQGGLQPRPRHYTDFEISAYGRYYEGVTKPQKVIRDIGRGIVTREGVEGVRVVYPNLFQKMQQDTMQQLQKMNDLGKKLPYHKRLRLGVLLNIPADETMDPAFMAAMQATKDPQGEAQEEGTAPGRPSPRPIKSNAEAYGTLSDRLANPVA